MHLRYRFEVDAGRRRLDVELRAGEVEVELQHARGAHAVALERGRHLVGADAEASSHVVQVREARASGGVEAEVVGAEQSERIDGVGHSRGR